jgi:hypothetical protein
MTPFISYTAIGLSFLLAAASGDYVLTLPSGERVCAKSAETCAAAQDAIRRGWWPVAAPEAETACQPSPACFSARSLCIVGHSCR